MDVVPLENYWFTLALKYPNDTPLVKSLWMEITRNYHHKNRYYHNLNHLCHMFANAFEYKDRIEDFDTLCYSIFYHDFVYKPRRADNEEKSAVVARISLKQLEVPQVKIEKCEMQILATKTHARIIDRDTNYLVDFDLAILGVPLELYQNYARQVRKEYASYPDFLYKPGRKKVLNHFLKMEQIFNTKDFVQKYEEKARGNILTELRSF